MTEATPAAQAPAAAETATATPTPEAAKTPPWGSDENFKPAEAWELIQNLRKEKAGGDTEALKTQLTSLQQAQESQRKAMAEALGLSEAPKSEDALAETVKNLQQQFQASQLEATRLRIAAEKNIPAEYHDLLTETDTEKLKAQAEKVGALVAAKKAADGTPAFQANPGQGQGGAPSTPEAIAEAEYAKYYPTPNRK